MEYRPCYNDDEAEMETMPLTLPRPRWGQLVGLSSMIQKIEVIMKKAKYVDFVIDNNAICANIINLGDGVK
jgi:hypothetical protein